MRGLNYSDFTEKGRLLIRYTDGYCAFRLCLQYIGWLLFRNGDQIGEWNFCSHIKPKISSRSLCHVHSNVAQLRS